MGRLQQLNPRNYRSSAQISEEFESVIRYLNAAEKGNMTLSEMLSQVFDEGGIYEPQIAFRSSDIAIEYRTGEEGQPWTTLVGLSALRGLPGRDVGTVPLPILSNRLDLTTSSSTATVSYNHVASDFLFVLKNGLLLREGADYTTNPVAKTVTFTPAVASGNKVTIYKARGEGGITIDRTDFSVSATQSVFGVAALNDSAGSQVLVYLNGILLGEGDDFVVSYATATITLLSAAQSGDVLSVVVLLSTAETTVTGFMLEGRYTDPATGLIPYSKLAVPAGAISADKVSGLQSFINATAKRTVASVPPLNPNTGDFWLDTSETPNALKFWNGSEWLRTSPTDALPPVQSEHAGLLVAVNSTGSGYVYRAFETTGLIPTSQKGAAGGVATLGTDGRLTYNQIPEVRVTDSIFFKQAGAITAGTLQVQRLFGERVRIKGMSVKTTNGSATVQLSISGAPLGSSYSATSIANDIVFVTPIEIDAISLSKNLELLVSSPSSPNDLFVTFIVERLN